MKKRTIFWQLVKGNKLFLFDSLFRVGCLAVLYVYLSIDFWDKADLTIWRMILILVIFTLPIIIYALNVFQIFSRKCKTAKNEGSPNHKILFTFQNRHFIAFISILIFYTSLLAGWLIFLPKPPTTLPPRFAPGAFGLRSWKSTVVIDSLEVHYLDSLYQWRKIPDQILWDSSNWCHPTTFGREELCPAVSFKKHAIVINSCAIIFSPKVKDIPHTFTNFRIKTMVKFATVDDKSLYPGFMFLSHVAKGEPSKNIVAGTEPPRIDSIFERTIISASQVQDCNYSELCLQFNLNFYDVAHPWLPALDWMPKVLSQSTVRKMRKHGDFTTPLSLNQNYRVSAIVFDEQIIFLGHGNIGTCILYETRFAD